MNDTSGSALVQRMRLARRVADVLVPQEAGVSIVAASAGDALSAPRDESPIRADFVITALDLRLLLSLLVNTNAEALDDPQMLKAANILLWEHPESAACVLIADDDALTCRIVEWGDRPDGTPKSEIASRISKQGSLRDTVMGFVNTFTLPWPEPSTLTKTPALSFGDAARRAALSAVEERQAARRSPIPERAQARASLTAADAEWAVRLALSVANSDHVDLDEELKPRSSTAGDRQ